jgi:hypothetical protein
MSTKLEHGKGDELAVSTTAVIEYLSPNATNGGGNQEFADEIEIWNTGAADVRIQFNIEASAFTVANGGIIPAGEKSVRFNLRNPITKFVYATESGTSTLKYFAS